MMPHWAQSVPLLVEVEEHRAAAELPRSVSQALCPAVV